MQLKSFLRLRLCHSDVAIRHEYCIRNIPFDSLRGLSAFADNTAMDIFYSDNPSNVEVESLLELTHVAHWHWTHRGDKTPQNISVALWGLSRAYEVNGFG